MKDTNALGKRFTSSIDLIVNPVGLPRQWTLSNYSDAFQDDTMLRSFLNTSIVTVCGVLVQGIVGFMAAFGVITGKRHPRSSSASVGSFPDWLQDL
ncbi:hypothetical protein [Bifidobacterium aquikefiri]